MVTAQDQRPEGSCPKRRSDREAAVGAALVISTWSRLVICSARSIPPSSLRRARGHRDLAMGIQPVDDLLDGGGDQVGVGFTGQMTFGQMLTDAVTAGGAGVGEALHQATHGLGDALLPGCGPRLDAQIGGVRHAPVARVLASWP